MKILVWGAGAIGGSIAAVLNNKKYDVTVVDIDTNHVNTINKQGMHISGPILTLTEKIKAYLPSQLPKGSSYDLIYLSVKGQDTKKAIESLTPYLSENGCVVSLQNGLLEPLIESLLGKGKVVGAFINYGADYIEPGHIMYGGRGSVVVGEIDGSIQSRTKLIHQQLCKFDQEAILTDNIYGYLWGKLGYGSLLFASAITNLSIAEFLDKKEWQDFNLNIAQEVMKVADANKVQPLSFNGFDPVAFLSGDKEKAAISFNSMVAHNQKSLKTHSGIWRDLAVRKRKTEVRAFINPIREIASKHNVNTPWLSEIVSTITDIEEGRCQQGDQAFESLINRCINNH